MVVFRNFDPETVALALPVMTLGQRSRMFGPAQSLLIDTSAGALEAKGRTDWPEPEKGLLSFSQSQIDDISRGMELRTRRKIVAYLRKTIAKQEAESETLEQMKKLDAAHILDSIVGGHEEDAEHMAMRPRGANRRVGSAWSKGRRREALVNAVKKALKAGKKKMDVHLKVCEEGDGVS